MFKKLNIWFGGLNTWLKMYLLGCLVGDAIIIVVSLMAPGTISPITVGAVSVFQIVLGIIIVAASAFNKMMLKWGKWLSDDINDVREGRITHAMIAVFGLGVMVVWFAQQAYKYHEFEVKGWLFPVWVWALLVALFFYWWAGKCWWYQNTRFNVPYIMYGLVVGVMVISIWCGTYAIRRDTRNTAMGFPRYATYYLQSNPWIVRNFAYILQDGGLFECHDESSCQGVMVLGGILVGVLLITGSLTVPHFWIFAAMFCIAFMVRFTIKELKRRQSTVLVDITP